MKTFACGAVVPGCTANFQAHDEDVLLQEVAAHARKDHGLATLPADLVEQVRGNIVTL